MASFQYSKLLLHNYGCGIRAWENKNKTIGIRNIIPLEVYKQCSKIKKKN